MAERIDGGDGDVVPARRVEGQLADERVRLEAAVDHLAACERRDQVGGGVGRAGEEPGAVAQEGSAERSLVARDQTGPRDRPGRRRMRPPRRVLRHVEEVAVELVGAGLGDDAGDAAHGAAVLRPVAGGVAADLGERAGGQEDPRAAAGAGVRDVDAIDEGGVLLPQAAVDDGRRARPELTRRRGRRPAGWRSPTDSCASRTPAPRRRRRRTWTRRRTGSDRPAEVRRRRRSGPRS